MLRDAARARDARTIRPTPTAVPCSPPPFASRGRPVRDPERPESPPRAVARAETPAGTRHRRHRPRPAQELRRQHRHRGPRPAHPGRAVHGRGRALGLRQEHPAAPDPRPGARRPPAGSPSKAAGAPARTEPPKRIMFQEPRLLPWARVVDNVAVGLGEGGSRAERRDAGAGGAGRGRPRRQGRATGPRPCRAASASAWRWPAPSSAGPGLLALDEPLGALDALTRIDMQALIERIWRAQGFTAILVTHDVAEAVAMADRILVVEAGRIALDLAVDVPRPRRRGDRRPRARSKAASSTTCCRARAGCLSRAATFRRPLDRQARFHDRTDRRPLVPADPRRRPLPRRSGGRPRRLARLSAPDRAGRRRARLLRRAAADRPLLRGFLGRRLGAGAR